MQAKRRDEQKEKAERLIDHISLSRLNYALYVMVLLVAIMIAYYVIAEFIIYSGQLASEDISVSIITNEAQAFADGFHPVLVISSTAPEESMITIKVHSAGYSTQYSSGEYVNNYTALAILPNDAFSTLFEVTATATDENGIMHTTMTHVRSAEEKKVVFGVG